MRLIKNYCCMFVAGFYEELRNINDNLLNDPMKAIEYDLKAQKWENKIKEKTND